MSFGRFDIRLGMTVVGSDKGRIGRVKQVRDADFLASRARKPDATIPFALIEHVTRDGVILQVPAHDLENAGWAPASGVESASSSSIASAPDL